MRQCTHARKGIVTTHPNGYSPDGGHAARNCCDRPDCIRAAISWCASKANRTAYYVADADRAARPEVPA
jgi:hypothetical protein